MFYVPLASQLVQSGQQFDLLTANITVASWLAQVANVRLHGTTYEQPAKRLREEIKHLQPLATPWRGDGTMGYDICAGHDLDGSIAGSDFLRIPIMHRTRLRNCRTCHTCRTLPILLACLSVLTLLSAASIDAVAQTAAADTRYEFTVPSPDGIGKRYMDREIAGVMGWEGAQ